MTPVPVVDLFAGPGGLGEGFSALDSGTRFRLALSVEMDPTARETLRLRSLFRKFAEGQAPADYYAYVRGELPFDDLAHRHPDEFEAADREAWCAQLGVEPARSVKRRVSEALGGSRTEPFVLVGGPPCQAYSLVGRSRMRSALGEEFDSDHRHLLYREYLRILADHTPAIFVLENVRGLLSSQHRGERIFERIVDDLRKPGAALGIRPSQGRALEYELFPIGPVVHPRLLGNTTNPEDFLLRAEELGLPQARHRVIVVGVHRDLADHARAVLQSLVPTEAPATVADAIGDLPPLRSGISRSRDGAEEWVQCVRAAARELRRGRQVSKEMIGELAKVEAELAVPVAGRGGEYVPGKSPRPRYRPDWFTDPRIKGVLNHATKGHIQPNLARYLFAAVFARTTGRSPQVSEFPSGLLPPSN